MRIVSRLFPLSLALLAAVAGCHGGVDIRTMSAPEPGLNTLHTFRILPAPRRRDLGIVEGDDDPMMNNSIARSMLRERLIAAFQSRGYVLDSLRADFGVAFYTTSRERVDPSVWDYGYPFYPDWPHYPPSILYPNHHVEGTVVVDVVKLEPRRHVWRGEGVAELTNDANDNVQQLARAAAMIVARFPMAVSPVVAAQR